MRSLRVLAVLGALVLGAAVALLAVLDYRSVTPWGLLVAVAASVATPWRLVLSREPRTATTYVAGWLAVLVVVVLGRPEGDYALTADLRGYTLMAVGLVLVPFAVVGLSAPRGSGP